MSEHDPRRAELGPFDATMLVMGGIVGVGIFFTPAQVAAQVPVGGAFLGMWVLGALVATCGAMTFAELGGTFPRAGGWFEFLREIYGPFVAFLFAWVVLGVVATGAIAVIASFGAETLLATAGFADAPGAVDPAAHLALAAALLVAITGLVLFGVKVGATVQNVVMVAKLTAMAALVVGGIAYVAPGDVPAAPPPEAPGFAWSGLAAATLPVFFAFGGWQHVCYVADRVRDPQRTVPRAIVVGVAGVGLVYLLVNVAFLRVLGVEELATASSGFAGAAAERAFGDGGARALRGAMAVSAIGVCVVNVIVTPAIFVGMARSGLFFRSFARLNARGAPAHALGAQLALALGYLAWAHAPALLGGDGGRGNVDALTGSVVFAEWVFHALTAWGLLRLRRRRPELPRPYRSLAYPLAPLVYLAVALGVLGGNLGTAAWSRTGVGLAVLAAGALVYGPWRRFLRAAR